MSSKKVDVSEQVVTLVKKAVEAADANDALKFSQAACNAANAACASNSAATIGSDPSGD
jgi:hypothetical protein